MSRPPIRNLVEDHALDAYARLVKNFADFCGCEVCRVDVLVYALNRIPPRYVSGLEGTVVTDVNLDKDQNRAAIEVAVMEGLRKVRMAPRHGPRPAPR